MTQATVLPNGLAPFDCGPLACKASPRTIYGAVALALAGLAGAWMLDARPAAAPPTVAAPATMAMRQAVIVVPQPVAALPAAYSPLLDPDFSLGLAPVGLAERAPLGPDFAAASPPPLVVAETETVVPVPVPSLPAVVEIVPTPIPAPRPPELQEPPSRAPYRPAGRRLAPQDTAAVPAATPPDTRNFIEKLFGMSRPSGPLLAYAAPEDGEFGNSRNLGSGAVPPYDRLTAVYDIAAHTVYMPDGTHLEAHSGLGDRLDDPRHVNERMRGATPPHVYDLQLREALFHGVQALRLNPVGGGGVFGRTGLLAHTYMLGPNGDSNGCVSFRNYNAFLRAYVNGEVRRLAVVARLN